MRRVGWWSHGWSHGKTVSSFCVGRETYSVFQHLNLQKKIRKSTWWEEHLIPQLTQQDPNVFIYQGLGDSHIFWKCLSGIEGEKQCMVRGDFSSHTYTVPWEDPTFPQFSDCNLLRSKLQCSAKKKIQKNHHMMMRDSLSSHGRPHISLL